MNTNRITKQALLYKPKGGVTWDVRGKDRRTKFSLSVEEPSSRWRGYELLPSYLRRTNQFFSGCAGCFEWESDYTQLKTSMRNSTNHGNIFYEIPSASSPGPLNCVIVASNVFGSTVLYLFHSRFGHLPI